MNILQIHNFYNKRGGAESHFFGLVDLLQKNGHNVKIFSTKNKYDKDNKIWPRYYDLSKQSNIFEKIIILPKFFINFSAIRKLKKLLKNNKIDIAHIHNIYHHLTPSILQVLKKNKIPIVMTLHDYKVICPNYNLFDFNKSEICEKCKDKNYFHCSKNKCIKNSKTKSLLATLEMYFQRKFFAYHKFVDVFIAPSEFMKNKLKEFNFENSNIEVVPNFVEQKKYQEHEAQNYFLFFGRLSKEKGLEKFIKALSRIQKDFNFYIAGAGPQESNLKDLTKKLGLESKIKFLGYFGNDKKEELGKLIKESQFVVAPSICYENCSISILESMAIGKTVFASNIGGNAELINNAKNGILYNANDEGEFIDKLTNLIDNKELQLKLGKQANIDANALFNKDVYYERLMKIYNK